MSISSGFIVSIQDETDFYEIKRFIQSLPNARLVYCTRNSREHLFIRTEYEVSQEGKR